MPIEYTCLKKNLWASRLRKLLRGVASDLPPLKIRVVCLVLYLAKTFGNEISNNVKEV
jgi:hypothetical protein